MIKEAIPCDPLIAICAFRYALGRRTYVTWHVADWLTRNKHHLRDGDAALIVREIDDHKERFGLGDPCDENAWMQLREAMTR